MSLDPTKWTAEERARYAENNRELIWRHFFAPSAESILQAMIDEQKNKRASAVAEFLRKRGFMENQASCAKIERQPAVSREMLELMESIEFLSQTINSVGHAYVDLSQKCEPVCTPDTPCPDSVPETKGKEDKVHCDLSVAIRDARYRVRSMTDELRDVRDKMQHLKNRIEL